MAENNFRDIEFSDSDDDEFLGFDPVDINDVEIREIDEDDIQLEDDKLEEIENELDREEHDPTFEAYDCDWLRNFDVVSGPQNFDEDSRPYDIFTYFFNDEVLDLFVEQTNLYYEQYIHAKGGLENLQRFARAKAWTPVTVPEMKVFFALILYMGLVRLPNYDLYWSTDDLINMKLLSTYMTRDRFLNILSFLHAADNSREPPRDHPNHDPGYKITKIASLLVNKWQAAYKPKREISVDETLIPFKGRTKLLQYIPNKPHKWGIKAWTLADSLSGYVFNWELYTGKGAADPRGRGVAHRVVTSLCTPLYDLGYHVYCDNFFTSPALFDELSEHQTGACGTLRSNRIGVPAQVKNAKPPKGDPPQVHRDGIKLYVTWHDKRLVNVLSTVHNSSTFTKRVRSRFHQDNYREVQNPKLIQLYTKYMGGVDLADQQVSYCALLHRMLKWWKKVVICNLLEVCVSNSKIIYKELNPGKKVKPEKFRLKVIHGLLDGYDAPYRPFRRPASNPELRLSGRHFITLNPHRTRNGKRSKPDCEVCSDRSHKRHQTTYFCRECEKPMCPVPCFERYHTLQNYKIQCSDDLHN